MKVQVIHTRGPDDCTVEVFIDGRVASFEFEDVDPGRGYDWFESWRDRVLEACDNLATHPNDPHAQATYVALVSASESGFITHKPEHWREEIDIERGSHG